MFIIMFLATFCVCLAVPPPPPAPHVPSNAWVDLRTPIQSREAQQSGGTPVAVLILVNGGAIAILAILERQCSVISRCCACLKPQRRAAPAVLATVLPTVVVNTNQRRDSSPVRRDRTKLIDQALEMSATAANDSMAGSAADDRDDAMSISSSMHGALDSVEVAGRLGEFDDPDAFEAACGCGAGASPPRGTASYSQTSFHQ